MEPDNTKEIVALIAVLVPFVGLLITKEQKISEFRQEWINTLRSDIAKFIGQVDTVRKLILINIKTEGERKEDTAAAVLLDSTEMRELQSKITLLINPKEEKHQELVDLLDTTINMIIKDPINTIDYDRITSLSQEILKEEWKRVKNGEPIYKISKFIFGFATSGILIYLVCSWYLS